jgi:hypothetical protein
MANKSFGLRVPNPHPKPTISGMDGQQMHNEILLGLPRKECDALFPDLECKCEPMMRCMKRDSRLRMVTS